MNKIIKICGLTSDKKPVLGGSFQMADTMGLPLDISLEEAEKAGCVISIPHYFASAIEAGWDDQKAFSKIKEAFNERRINVDFELIEKQLVFMFTKIANENKGKTASEIGSIMRKSLEIKGFEI